MAATSPKHNFEQLSDLIYDHILNRIKDTPLSGSEYEARAILQKRLEDVKPLLSERSPAPENVPDLTNRAYSIYENPDGIERLHLSVCEGLLRCQLILRSDDVKTLTFRFARPVHARDVFIKDISLHEQEVALTQSLLLRRRKGEKIEMFTVNSFIG